MAYGVVKVGIGLLGIGLSVESALRDGSVSGSSFKAIKTEDLGKPVLLELPDAFMCDIEKQGELYKLKESVRSARLASRLRHEEEKAYREARKSGVSTDLAL